MSFAFFVSFQKKIEFLCLFNLIQMYVLFHLNILILFQEINMIFFSFKIELVSNKKLLP
jgi:hypothetical protein